jgi:phage protein D
MTKPRVYASEADAKQAAKADAAKRKRDSYQFEYELAVADARLQPNQKVTLAGWGGKVDQIKWLASSIDTTMGSAGLKQRLTLEGA